MSTQIAIRDWFINILSLCLAMIILQFVLIYLHFKHIPKIIPVHFDSHNTPNRFANKNLLWIIPAAQLIVLLFFYFKNRDLNKIPRMNWPIHPEHWPAIIRFRRVWLAMFMLNMLALVTYVVFTMLPDGHGQQPELQVWIVLLFAVLNVIIVFGGIMRLQDINAGRKTF